jgi:hypothetical protein
MKNFLSHIGVYVLTAGALGIFLLPISLAAQDKPDKITPREAKQASALGRRFAVDMVRYKDFAPLIPKYFLPGFEQKLPEAALVCLPNDIERTPHVKKGLRRFYIAQNNFLLLVLLYNLSGAVEVDAPDDENLPRDVQAVIDSQKDLWNVLMKDGKLGKLTTAQSNRHFDESLFLFDEINKRMRKHVAGLSIKDKKVKDYLNSDTPDSYKTFDPWVKTCSNECYLNMPFPKGTRLLVLELPFLQQLVLVSHRGRLRVVANLVGD